MDDDLTPVSTSNRAHIGRPIHPDDLPRGATHVGYDPKRDPTPGFFVRLFGSVESKQAQAERLQREAEEDADRLTKLAFALRNMEATRQRLEDDLVHLEAEYKRLVAGRSGWLENARAGWRKRQYDGSMMAEVDYIIADYPAHRALLGEQLKAAQAAIEAFKREHKAS